MKRSITVLTILICLLSFGNVYASEDIYYTNENGVSMTKREYDFFSEMYWDGYQEYMKQADYNMYASKGFYNFKVNKAEYEEPNVSPFALIHETTAKKLEMTYGCNGGSCTMNTILQWKGDPTVKSYDVIGSYGSGGITRVSTPITTLTWSGPGIEYIDRVYSGNNGWGTSVLLQNSTTAMRIVQYVNINVASNGVYYSSYQHARENVSLETSKSYTIGFGGYGGVFFFNGNAVGKYDHMAGVNVALTPNS